MTHRARETELALEALGPMKALSFYEEEQERERRNRMRREVSAAKARLAAVPIDAEVREAIWRGDELSGPALDVVRGWISSDRPALVLSGPPGVGKTVAGAWAVVNHGGEYISARDMVKRSFAFDVERERWPELPKTGLVLLDDLGAQTDSAERLNQSLCHLLEGTLSGLRVVATTNLAPAALRDLLDDRARDRLNNVAKLAVITGPSRRRQDGGF